MMFTGEGSILRQLCSKHAGSETLNTNTSGNYEILCCHKIEAMR